MDDAASALLDHVTETAKSRFDSQRTVLSFPEYLDDVAKAPRRHLRNAATYMADVIEYFGNKHVELPTGEFTRYQLFDPVDEEDVRVVGQERVQESLVRLIMNFVRSGRIDRLLLLHGPNGSAKTSIIQALTRAAEVYSHSPEGALYRFNWVFPTSGARRGSLGFGSDKRKAVVGDSYAHLEGTDVEARLPCEFKDHPLLLLSPPQRAAFISDLRERGRLDRDAAIPRVIQFGDLSMKNRQIFDALLTSYHGEVGEVLRHIQVERFYLSRRYRRGVVAVEPQMSVDANARQITADRTLGALPPALQHLSLYETMGALNDANRGVLEFNDLLKRPLEAWKYLLVATEQAQASLDPIGMFLDVLMLASSNEIHLAAFKEHPDWASFKGRIELVKVPYLLRVSDELEIYTDQIPRMLTGVHIAPHALEVAARWAVLTRLEPPDPDLYPDSVNKLIEGLTPEEKLDLYDHGGVPERLSQKERRNLREYSSALYAEFKDMDTYEGWTGASVREVRMALLNAAQNPHFDHLSPIAVIDELRQLVKETSTYRFLGRESVRGYRDASAFVDSVEAHYGRQLDEEIRAAMGLVEEGSHRDLFQRYLKHVSAWTKSEKLADALTGKLVEPDKELMREVEDVLLAEDEAPEDFRRSLISQIGAAKLERPDAEIDYDLLFGTYMRRLEESYYDKHVEEVERISEAYLKLLEDDTKGIDAKVLDGARLLRKNLEGRGYNDRSGAQAVAYLLKLKRSRSS
jgi:serine protein kinase